jgi:hypothetical protein
MPICLPRSGGKSTPVFSKTRCHGSRQIHLPIRSRGAGPLKLIKTRQSSQCDDGSGAPTADCVEIEIEVSVPMSAHSVPVVFSRAEGDPDPSTPKASRDSRYLKWVSQRCSSHFLNACSDDLGACLPGKYVVDEAKIMFIDHVIVEAQNYEAMSNDILKLDPNPLLRRQIADNIDWARRTLRKNDRIVWFLRWAKLWLLSSGAASRSTRTAQAGATQVGAPGPRSAAALAGSPAAMQQHNRRFGTAYGPMSCRRRP